MSEIYWAPWPKPPLNLNQRLHHFDRSKLTKQVRGLGKRDGLDFCLNHGIQSLISVQMVWIVPDRRRRDEENIVATLKPYCDGLVDAGLVPDDTPQFMVKHMPRIVYVKGDSRVYFEVEAIDDEPAVRALAA